MMTLKNFREALFEERKSKFYVYVKPVQNLSECKSYIKEISVKNRDATHNVYAYIICDEEGVHEKAEDDGEPSGTAAKPILDIIRYAELTNVVVIVSRYFGGIKLGAGGLIRAYAAAAKLGLENGEKIPFEKKVECMIEFDYILIKTVDNFLITHGIMEVEKGFLERVIYKFSASEELHLRLSEIQGITII